MDASAQPGRPFPATGGEFTTILRGIDWSRHPRGEPAGWPVELKTAVRICLTSRFASMVKHRMKNTMAMVQSTVNQALRRSDDMDEGKRLITAQIGALARTNDLLTRSDDLDASLAAIVQGPAEMQGAFSKRISSTGPDLALNPKAAIAFTMLLDELTTNAMKYGALSNDAGHAHVEWHRDDSALEFSWKESSGPPVTPSVATGFGTRLMAALSGDLGGQPKSEYDPAGVRCTLRWEIRGIVGKPGSAPDTAQP